MSGSDGIAIADRLHVPTGQQYTFVCITPLTSNTPHSNLDILLYTYLSELYIFLTLLLLWICSILSNLHFFHAELSTHSPCLFTNSKTISSSISFTGNPGCRVSWISMRNHISWKELDSSAARPTASLVCSIPGGREGSGFLETNTTSNLRRCRSLPMTTWWPYRSRACRAFGMRRAWSVSSFFLKQKRKKR